MWNWFVWIVKYLKIILQELSVSNVLKFTLCDRSPETYPSVAAACEIPWTILVRLHHKKCYSEN